MVIKCGRLYKQWRLFRFTWKSVEKEIENSERTWRSSVCQPLTLPPLFNKAFNQNCNTGSMGGGEADKSEKSAFHKSRYKNVRAYELYFQKFFWSATLSGGRVCCIIPLTTSAPRGTPRKASKIAQPRVHTASICELSFTAAITWLRIQGKDAKKPKIKQTIVRLRVGEQIFQTHAPRRRCFTNVIIDLGFQWPLG